MGLERWVPINSNQAHVTKRVYTYVNIYTARFFWRSSSRPIKWQLRKNSTRKDTGNGVRVSCLSHLYKRCKLAKQNNCQVQVMRVTCISNHLAERELPIYRKRHTLVKKTLTSEEVFPHKEVLQGGERRACPQRINMPPPTRKKVGALDEPQITISAITTTLSSDKTTPIATFWAVAASFVNLIGIQEKE